MARGQGCNVTDDEIERVVDFIKRQGNPVFNPRFLDLEPPKPQQAEEIQSTGTPEDDLVKLLYKAYTDVTGDTVNKPFTVGGGTYAGILNKGVAYGMGFPGEEELAHQKDEYLSIESLLKGVLIYINAILLLGEVDA